MSQNIFELIMNPGVEADIASIKSKMLILLNYRLNEICGNEKGKVNRRQLMQVLEISSTEASRISTSKMDSLSIERLIKYLRKVDVKMDANLVIDELQNGERKLIGVCIETVKL